MKELRGNLRVIAVLLAVAFAATAYGFVSEAFFQGTRLTASRYNARLTAAKGTVTAGSVLDRNGTVLATTGADGKRVYLTDDAARRALSQTVGDARGNTVSAVESFYAGALYGITGSAIDRFFQWFRGENVRGDDLTLAIDANLTAKIAAAFPAGHDGALALIDYKTGEVYAMVSKPDYDPYDPASAVDTAYLNRCVQCLYAPGSAFKLVTAAAALESLPGLSDREFACEGERTFGAGAVRCAGNAVHGGMNLRQAFAKSCNVTFAALSYEMGRRALANAAERAGFNDDFNFAELVLVASRFPTEETGEFELAWAGVGQSTVLATPMHMAMLAGSVANGGVWMEPRLVLKQTGATGISRLRTPTGAYRQTMDTETANAIASFMRAAVTDGTAKNAAVEGLKVCGKTGSAEVSDDKTKPTNAWFVGYLDEPDYPFALAVVIEGGGAGGDAAAKLASLAFQLAVSAKKADT